MLQVAWEGTELFDNSEGKCMSNKSNKNFSQKVQVLLLETTNLWPEALCVTEILILEGILRK